MDPVEEIEAAIERLPPEQFARITRWLHEREQQRWDDQLDGDSAAGKLDFLFDEAGKESSAGFPRCWPEPE